MAHMSANRNTAGEFGTGILSTTTVCYNTHYIFNLSCQQSAII